MTRPRQRATLSRRSGSGDEETSPLIQRRDGGEDARARLASRRAGRAPGDHSEADEPIYERMRAQPFEPPAEGFLQLVNGPQLAEEIDRIVAAVEAGS